MGRVPHHSLDGQTIVTGICVSGVLGAILIGAATLIAASVIAQVGLFEPVVAQMQQLAPR